MVSRIGGARRKTRKIFSKTLQRKGKISITRFLDTFDVGQKVLLDAEPAYQNGMYFRRYHGKVGTVEGSQGTCYKVRIQDKNASKVLVVHPVHLRRR